MKFLDKVLFGIRAGWRNLMRQRNRSLLVVSAAMFGTMGTLFLLANLNAFFESMIHLSIDSGLGHVQIRPAGYGINRKTGVLIPDSDQIIGILEKNRQDMSFSPRLEREGIIRSGSAHLGVMITGIDPVREKKISKFSQWVSQGKYFDAASNQLEIPGTIPCLIGKAAAQKLEMEIGDYVVLSINNKEGAYKSIRSEIYGIFESPSDELDKSIVLVKKDDLSRLYLSQPGASSYIVIRGADLDDALQNQSQVQELLGDSKGIEVSTWKEIEPMLVQLFEFSAQFRWIGHLIMMLGFALIVFDSVSMSVYDRMHEIGVMRAIGSRSSLVFYMVVFESVMLTAAGSLMGILIGGLVTLYFNVFGLELGNFSQGLSTMGMGSVIYPFFTFKDLFESLLVATTTGFLSAIYPAIKAIRLVPVKAIYNK